MNLGSLTYLIEAFGTPSPATAAPSHISSTPSSRHPKLLRIDRQPETVVIEVFANQDGKPSSQPEAMYSIVREEFDNFVRAYLMSSAV